MFSSPHRSLLRWRSRPLTESDLSQQVKNVEYAIRGPIEHHANHLASRLARGESFSFSKLIPCHIGNPYAVGKPVLTFPRQVLSVAEYPEVAKSGLIPDEAVDRALHFINNNPATLGAYSPLQGFASVRANVANFISRRDKVPSDLDQIFLTQGATAGIVEVFQTILGDKKDGVVLPIPDYPLYSALVSLFGAVKVPYYLREETGWSFDEESLLRSIRRARDDGVRLKAMVVINPGNPTGSVLRAADMRKMVEICEDEGMILVADEVYQENVYGSTEWQSFKKVAAAAHSKVQLVSLNSISKGFVGECGHRGGYLELQNIDARIIGQLQKLLSLSIAPNSPGQLLLDIQMSPPTGSVCGKQWQLERSRELQSLEKRAKELHGVLAKLPGMKLQQAAGALYLFPTLEIPGKYAKTLPGKLAPDLGWSLRLMDEEGIVVTAGSGFGQRQGTNHFRITFLPTEGNMAEVMHRMSRFQLKFMNQFG
jgi:aspartate/methionine/tyrosine aminotransferase